MKTSTFLAGLAAAVAAATGSAAGRAPASPTAPLTGKVFLTTTEALELAFPECEVVRRRVYLTKEETERIEELAKTDPPDRVAFVYEARRDGELVGTACFDVHRVRTLKETLMVALEPDGSILRIELLAFGEPPDYIPRGSWYGQFVGKRLEDDLEVKRGVRGVTGATLTARATAAAARRTLALRRVLGERARR